MGNKTWVLLLTNVFGATGGIPAFNREFVEAFQKIAQDRGWTLTLYVLNDSEDQEPPSKAYGYHTFGGHRWRFLCAALRAARKADGVFFGHVHLAPLALAIPHAHCWLVAHGIEVWDRLSWLRRWGLSRMDRILCVSRFTRDRLIQRHHIQETCTVLFPNTARLSSLQAMPPKAGLQKTIFTVSRLWPEERYKKIDRVIEAIPAVLKAVPDAHYVIAGEGGDRPRLERLARDLHVDKQVIFTGAISDQAVTSYYNACDVFILPSLGEGFGIVFLEAMACGKPCIGADAGAVPEVIQEGRTGLLVKPDNTEAVAEALICLLTNESLRARMGDAGRQRFLSEYATDRFQERLARITDHIS